MSLKGYKQTEEHKRKISEANKGRKHSEETKRKISKAIKKVIIEGGIKYKNKNCKICGVLFTPNGSHSFYCKKCQKIKQKEKQIRDNERRKIKRQKRIRRCYICNKIIDRRKRICDDCKSKKRNRKIRARRLRLRFMIFQRDNFTCQYCGRKSPEVILEVDHKYPKSKGGLNKMKNYITSCRECNIGKGDVILDEFKSGLAPF